MWLTSPSFVLHAIRCQTSTPCSNSCQCNRGCVSNAQPMSGGEGAVDGLSWTFFTLPRAQLVHCSQSYLAIEAQVQCFWLVSILVQLLFFILLTLIALSIALVSVLLLLISTSAPLWHSLSTSLSSWPSFCVFDTVLSSFVVSFPSSVPAELISVSQVIIFFPPMDSLSWWCN